MLGRVLSDITRLKGSFQNPEITEESAVISGRGSVAEFMNYNRELMALTKGKGSISFQFDGYDECHNTTEEIEKLKYEKDKDMDNVSSSVFCAKGTSFVVKWDEVEKCMHCLS